MGEKPIRVDDLPEDDPSTENLINTTRSNIKSAAAVEGAGPSGTAVTSDPIPGVDTK